MFSAKESLAARLETSLPPPAVALKALLLFFHLEAQLFFFPNEQNAIHVDVRDGAA